MGLRSAGGGGGVEGGALAPSYSAGETAPLIQSVRSVDLYEDPAGITLTANLVLDGSTGLLHPNSNPQFLVTTVRKKPRLFGGSFPEEQIVCRNLVI